MLHVEKINMESKKKDRSANFSSSENQLLVNLIWKYSHIIENKKSDTAMWKDKDEAWNKVMTEFNAVSGQFPRNTKSLKTKYDALKKQLKKKASRNRQQRLRTGGGTASIEQYTSWEEILIKIISVAIDGLPSRNDGDTEDIDADEEFADLKSMSKIEAQSALTEAKAQFVEAEAQPMAVEAEAQPVAVEELPIAVLQNIEIIDELQEVVADNVGNAAKRKCTEISPWSSWNPQVLKQPVATPLRSGRSKLRSNKGSTESVSNLAAAKLELAKLQKDALEVDLNIKRKEAEVKLKALERENEVKAKILEQELKNQEMEYIIKKEILNGVKLDNDNKMLEKNLKLKMLSAYDD